MRRAIVACLVLGGAGSAFAAGGAIYRCGNEYSQAPCSQGKVVDTQDTVRSAAQRAEAVHVAASEKRLADDMARERRRAEAAIKPAGAGSLGPVRPAAPGAAKAPAVAKSKGKKKDASAENEDFVAVVPPARN